MSEYIDKLFSPVKLNGLELRNRVIRAGTFEAMCPDGYPSDRLINLQREAAEGGTGLTTVAYCAVEPDGRVKEDMMYMHEGIRPQVEQMTSAVHDAGGKISGQMGHCGSFSQNKNFQGRRPLGPSPSINMIGIPKGIPFAGSMTHADIDRAVKAFHDAARFMKSAGFDALEIHFSHGYGLSQFISPKTNRRNDEYGGSLINRMRYPVRVLEAVRKAVGDDFPSLGKMGLTDGARGGLDTDEAVEVAAILDEAGIDALITSGGTSSMNPMYLFRGESILPEMVKLEKNVFIKLCMLVYGIWLIKDYPYEELYFLEGAKRVRDRIKHAKLCYIGGASTMESLETVMREFDFVQMGRALIKDPAFVNHAMADPNYINNCDHCNQCATLILHPDGIRCVCNDKQ